MTLTVSSGWKRGILFFIEEKTTGEIKAAVNKQNRKFGTWPAANQWVEDEVKRSYDRK